MIRHFILSDRPPGTPPVSGSVQSRQVEHLSGIYEPIKIVQDFGSFVTTGFRIDKNQQRALGSILQRGLRFSDENSVLNYYHFSIHISKLLTELVFSVSDKNNFKTQGN